MSPGNSHSYKFLSAQNPRSTPIPPQTWERYRELLLGLRFEMSVKDIGQYMEREHGFIATKDQYNNKFKKWNATKHGVPPNNSSSRGSRKSASGSSRLVTVVQERQPQTAFAVVSHTSDSSVTSPLSSTYPSPSGGPSLFSSSPSSSTRGSPASSSFPRSSSSVSSSSSSSSPGYTPLSSPQSTTSSPPSSPSSPHHYPFQSTPRPSRRSNHRCDGGPGRCRIEKHISTGSRAARVTASSTFPDSDTHSPARSSTRSISQGPDGRATTPSLVSDTETTYSESGRWSGGAHDRDHDHDDQGRHDYGGYSPGWDGMSDGPDGGSGSSSGSSGSKRSHHRRNGSGASGNQFRTSHSASSGMGELDYSNPDHHFLFTVKGLNGRNGSEGRRLTYAPTMRSDSEPRTPPEDYAYPEQNTAGELMEILQFNMRSENKPSELMERLMVRTDDQGCWETYAYDEPEPMEY